jgi:L-lactate dehydrogenase complex protein LldG
MSDARAAILGRIRASSCGPRASLTAPAPYRALPVPLGERLERFRSVLESVGGHVHLVPGELEASESLRAILVEAGARRLLVSDAPASRTLAEALPGEFARLAPHAPRAELLAADAGLTGAQWGIAETGTIVLESAREQHRLASLLPPLHIALLPASRLLGTLGEALAAVRGAGAAPGSRTITFITGPSRTADIELELVVGVHGPKHLHVILLLDPA